MSYALLVNLPTGVVKKLTSQQSAAANNAKESNDPKAIVRITRLPQVKLGSEEDGKRAIVHVLAISDMTLTMICNHQTTHYCQYFTEKAKPGTKPFTSAVKALLMNEPKIWTYNKTEQRFSLNPESFIDHVFIDAWSYSREDKKTVSNNAVRKSVKLSARNRATILQIYRQYADDDVLTLHEVGMRASSTRKSGFMTKGDRLVLQISESGLSFPITQPTTAEDEVINYLQLGKGTDRRIVFPAEKKLICISNDQPNSEPIPILGELKTKAEASSYFKKLQVDRSRSTTPEPKKAAKTTTKATTKTTATKAAPPSTSLEDTPKGTDNYLAAFRATYTKADLLRFLAKYESLSKEFKQRTTTKDLLARLDAHVKREGATVVPAAPEKKEKRKAEAAEPANVVKRPKSDLCFDFDINNQTQASLDVITQQYNNHIEHSLIPRRRVLETFISDVENLVALEEPPENADELLEWYATSCTQANVTLREYLSLLSRLDAAKKKILYSQRMLACGPLST
eukprot:TRINITY_DN22557_c0_g1_i1.p1 TRINITY_DN22557_c0_g1~~TRINITY_DN22557_c0_g1_i1.p1  ORF type:complete len:512 (+),score=92.29 TRINITY_DN22557_c0_g1_i1:66-1601(+)